MIKPHTACTPIMMSMTPAEAHAQNARNQERRNVLRDAMPALAMRVFALRGKFYSGCGFHYGMEKTVGTLLRGLNDFDTKFTWEDAMTMEVLYEDLVEQVTEIEAALEGKSA